MFNCPQCSCETEILHEGYCVECCENNQLELDKHNFTYDRWQSLTSEQRDKEIKFGGYHGNSRRS